MRIHRADARSWIAETNTTLQGNYTAIKKEKEKKKLKAAPGVSDRGVDPPLPLYSRPGKKNLRGCPLRNLTSGASERAVETKFSTGRSASRTHTIHSEM